MLKHNEVSLYATIKPMIIETPFREIISSDSKQTKSDEENYTTNADNLLAATQSETLRKQYTWLLAYSNCIYLEKKKFEYEKIISNEKTSIVEQVGYFNNLILYYIKNFLFNSVDDNEIENIIISDRTTKKYIGTTDINKIFYDVLLQYFEKTLDKSIINNKSGLSNAILRISNSEFSGGAQPSRAKPGESRDDTTNRQYLEKQQQKEEEKIKKQNKEKALKEKKVEERERAKQEAVYAQQMEEKEKIKQEQNEAIRQKQLQLDKVEREKNDRKNGKSFLVSPDILKEMTKHIDTYKNETLYTDISTKENIEKNIDTISNNLSKILKLFPDNFKDSIDFKNKTYIIDNNFDKLPGIDKKYVIKNSKLKFYETDDEKNLEYPFIRLKFSKIYDTLKDSQDTQIVNEFLNTFKDITDTIGKNSFNETLSYKFALILNSINNRNNILKKYIPNEKIKQLHPYLSRAFISYYRDRLDNLYEELTINILKPGILASLSISIIMYKALFNFIYKSMDDGEVIDIDRYNNCFPENNPLLTNFFIELKPFIDQYKKANPQLKVRLFCKINDNLNTIKDDADNNKKKLIGINRKDRIFTRKIDKENLSNKLDIYMGVNSTKTIKFNKVFDTLDNSIMSSYMAISNSIENLEGTILYTFGASGVGKSFTLFGAQEENKINEPGLLQCIINSVSDIEHVTLKIFEIYGKGFNDKDYWNETTTNSIFEKYIVHKITTDKKSFQYNEADILNFDSFTKLDVNGAASEYTAKINGDNINEMDFTNLIKKVENARKTGIKYSDNSNTSIKSVKATSNNPESSRSILIYEFIICKKINNKIIEIPLIVVDMPGKEIIANSYNCQAVPTQYNLHIQYDNINIKCTRMYSYGMHQNLKNMWLTIENHTNNDKDPYYIEATNFVSSYKKYFETIRELGNSSDKKIIAERKKAAEDAIERHHAEQSALMKLNPKKYTYVQPPKLKYDTNTQNISYPISIIHAHIIKELYDACIKFCRDNNIKNVFIEPDNKCKNELLPPDKKKEIFGDLPGQLCLNLHKYFKQTTCPKDLEKLIVFNLHNNLIKETIGDISTSTLFNILDSFEDHPKKDILTKVGNCSVFSKEMIDKTFLTFIQNISTLYNENKYDDISIELSNFTKDYYTMLNKDVDMKDFYDEIFEGIYINENINGAMEYLSNIKNAGTTIKSCIKENNTTNVNYIYDESKLFKKDIVVIKKLFDYYNNNPIENRAVIDNFVSFYVCANIAKNVSVLDAIDNNVKNNKLVLNENTQYWKQIKLQQINMFTDIEPLIKELLG